MSAEEQVLLVCMPLDGGPVFTTDATLDLATGDLAPGAGLRANPALANAAVEWFIRLKGHPARIAVACQGRPTHTAYRVDPVQLAQVLAALAERGQHPCAARRQDAS